MAKKYSRLLQLSRNKINESYYKIIGNSVLDMYEEMYLHTRKSNCVYARKINNTSNAFY